ncbi:MAG: CRISPR-associated endonuclease Cas2 [Candidatus Sumerlaeia bacterium]|nr:CRISPR-associated endonuclease Cas2 [Candidatus Sumerlaeia bacterium]
MAVSPYQIVWTIVMFDLPVRTKRERKAYTQFRRTLLENGFGMMQFSVYLRSNLTEEKAGVYETRIKAAVPDDGEVRILQVTERQLERMKVFYGKIPQAPEKASEQLEFF